ncbi:hypothetical protein FQN57_004092 [Myotisia sp. PD_48]|nr:hypothetical protein FQN57_004092 [Myotisia sp. PD_48]
MTFSRQGWAISKRQLLHCALIVPRFIATNGANNTRSRFDHDPAKYGDIADSDEENDVEQNTELITQYFTGLLGHGGFATVWIAHDIQQNQRIAFKIMAQSNTAKNETSIQRKLHEIRTEAPWLLIYLRNSSQAMAVSSKCWYFPS